MTAEELDQVVPAAVALLHAAILLRDMAGAMPVGAQASMPPDISNRFDSPRYQDAFDGLPHEVRSIARTIVNADPDLIEAQRVDRESRR